MKLRTTIIISILTIGLVAGSTVGVAAQEDEAESAAEPVQFVTLSRGGEDFARLEELLASGEEFDEDDFAPDFWTGTLFASFGDIPGGTVEWFGGNADDETASSTLIFDPDPPGGDTFTIYWQADVVETSGAEAASDESRAALVGTWNVLPGSGTGEFEGLTGTGRVYIVSQGVDTEAMSERTEVATYTGTLTMPE